MSIALDNRPRTREERNSATENLASQSKDFNSNLEQVNKLAAQVSNNGLNVKDIDLNRAGAMRAELATVKLREIYPGAPEDLIAQMRELILHSSTSISGFNQNFSSLNANVSESALMQGQAIPHDLAHSIREREILQQSLSSAQSISKAQAQAHANVEAQSQAQERASAIQLEQQRRNLVALAQPLHTQQFNAYPSQIEDARLELKAKARDWSLTTSS